MQQGNANNPKFIWYGLESKVNPGKNLYFINNTLVNEYVDMKGDAFITLRNDPEINAVIKNNMFTGDGEIVKDLNRNDLSDKFVDSSNLRNVNPGFADIANYDYHLTSAAAEAIDKGVDPGVSAEGYSLMPVRQYVHKAASESRPVCGKLDLGAYELEL